MVPVTALVSANVVILGPTVVVVKPAVKPLLVALWMWKPVSLAELSVHDKLICVEVADAVKAEGAAGIVTVPTAVTLDVLEKLD